MKKIILLASLLASTSAYATFPTNVMQRPAGFKDPLVEGVRVRPAQGCTWNEFKTDLIAHKTDAEWPYSIERYHNSTVAGAKYAVVFSAADQVFMLWYGDHIDTTALLPPAGSTVTTVQTINDADRLTKLKTFQKADKNFPLNPTSKSRMFRSHLVDMYTQKFNDRTDCVDFEGFEYKWRLATADPTQFVKSNANWAAYKQEYGLSESQKGQFAMAIIDGTVNLSGIKDTSGTEVIVNGDDGKPFIKQPYPDSTVPGDHLDSTVTDNSMQHGSIMLNLARELTEVEKVYILPTAPGGNVNMYSASTPKLNNATIDSLENAVTYLYNHYMDMKLGTIVITADIPPEGNLKKFYATLEDFQNLNIPVVVASGNDGIEEVPGEESTYPNLAGTMHIVGGAPVTTVGIVREDGQMSSNYGNPVDSVVRIKEDAKTIENYAPGGLTSVVDVTLTGLDLNTGSTGGSSYAAIIVGSLAIDLKAKFPWLSSDEFKTGLVDGLYENRPEPPFAASDAEIELFNKKWEKVHGGIFDARMLADYIKETYGKYRAVPESYVAIRDPAAPLVYALTHAGYGVIAHKYTAEEACAYGSTGFMVSIYNISNVVTTPPTFAAPGICTTTATNKSTGVNTVQLHILTIDPPSATINYYANTLSALLSAMNDPSKSLTNGQVQYAADTTNPLGWWVTSDGVTKYNMGPKKWLCDHETNNWGGTLITQYTDPMVRYCALPN